MQGCASRREAERFARRHSPSHDMMTRGEKGLGTGCGSAGAFETMTASACQPQTARIRSACAMRSDREAGIDFGSLRRGAPRAANGQQTSEIWLSAQTMREFEGANGPRSRMNRAIARPSSSIVVTVEVACHAGGRGFESRRSRCEKPRNLRGFVVWIRRRCEPGSAARGSASELLGPAITALAPAASWRPRAYSAWACSSWLAKRVAVDAELSFAGPGGPM